MVVSDGLEPSECQSQSLMPYHLATRQLTISGGGSWIWTMEPEGTDLQSAAFDHFANPPYISGADTRNRTRNLLITSQLLYQLSHVGKHKWWEIQDSNLWPPACKADALTNWANLPFMKLKNGAWDRTWTDMSFNTRRILSPVRLPIPPLRHINVLLIKTTLI